MNLFYELEIYSICAGWKIYLRIQLQLTTKDLSYVTCKPITLNQKTILFLRKKTNYFDLCNLIWLIKYDFTRVKQKQYSKDQA